jgi:hypothetical protein
MKAVLVLLLALCVASSFAFKRTNADMFVVKTLFLVVVFQFVLFSSFLLRSLLIHSSPFSVAHNGANQVESLVEVSSQVNSQIAAPASSTVIDQSNKLYWNSPGDGT